VNSAAVNSVSCSSPGNCSAGGYYSNGSTRDQAFVVNEVNGTWGNALEVPGSQSLNVSGNAMVNTISCTAPGDCAAGGSFGFDQIFTQGFVVDELDGVWGTAMSLDATSIDTISCATPGNCSAGGSVETGKYNRDHDPQTEIVIADEVNGAWGSAVEPPGSVALNSGGQANVDSISCATPGNCAAVGGYENSQPPNGYHSSNEALVVNEVNGVWTNAKEVPRSGVLNVGGGAGLNAVSCTTPGNCSAGGSYLLRTNHFEAFVVNEVDGQWGTATEVPGVAILNRFGDAEVSAISCGSTGNCSAGGYVNGGDFKASLSGRAPFVVNEVHGRWKVAMIIHGVTAPNSNSEIDTLSCSNSGVCEAGGSYTDRVQSTQAFVTGR